MASFIQSVYATFMSFSAPAQIFIMSILTVLIFISVFFIGKSAGRRLERRLNEENISQIRSDAVKRSRAVLGGQMVEQIAPFLPGFPCNPADVRFVGKPVDFVGFPGAAEGKPLEEILFIEVKSGSSVLSKREREIKNAVNAGRVRYVEYRELETAGEEMVSIADISPER
jgi:predicted Holliday junction resolvase-like endonuclease